MSAKCWAWGSRTIILTSQEPYKINGEMILKNNQSAVLNLRLELSQMAI